MQKNTGRKPASPEAKKARATRIAELRKRLDPSNPDLSQQDAAALAGDPISREVWVKLENGVNGASTVPIIAALANAAKVSTNEMADYLDEKINLDSLVARRRTDLDDRYHAMSAVRQMARLSNLEKHVATFTVDLKSDEQPSPDDLWTMFKAHVAREKNKSVVDRGDPSSDLGKPRKRARK